MSTTKGQRAKKAVLVPKVGEYLTDGAILVEVLAKNSDGYEVQSVGIPLGGDPAPMTLTPTEIGKGWRRVTPLEDDDG